VLKADIKLVPGPRSSSRNYDATHKMKVGRVRIASTRIFLRIYCVRQGAESAVEQLAEFESVVRQLEAPARLLW